MKKAITYLHIANHDTEKKKFALIDIAGHPIKLAIPPTRMFNNLNISGKAVSIIENDDALSFELSHTKKYHPDQLKFDHRYHIECEQFGSDTIYFSRLGNSTNPSKIIITFPGISNFDNVNYRLSALTSAQSLLFAKTLIVAFQDKEQVFGNYMYKTDQGVPIKDYVRQIIHRLLAEYQLTEHDLIFYGNSKGGSICFDHTSDFSNAKFYIDIPQIDLFNYKSQNDILRFSLGEECRHYHNHIHFLKTTQSSTITYSFAENDYDASRGIKIKQIPGIEVCMLKDMPHEGSAMLFVRRQLSKIAQDLAIKPPIVREPLQDKLQIDTQRHLMFFKRRLGAFKTAEELKFLYAEVRFMFDERPPINISLNQSFVDGRVQVEWVKGFNYIDHLPHLTFRACLIVYFKYQEYIYPLGEGVDVN